MRGVVTFLRMRGPKLFRPFCPENWEDPPILLPLSNTKCGGSGPSLPTQLQRPWYVCGLDVDNISHFITLYRPKIPRFIAFWNKCILDSTWFVFGLLSCNLTILMLASVSSTKASWGHRGWDRRYFQRWIREQFLLLCFLMLPLTSKSWRNGQSRRVFSLLFPTILILFRMQRHKSSERNCEEIE